eukprot:scaffold1522_cov166-Amphora_coffeaeformis.AAC.15
MDSFRGFAAASRDKDRATEPTGTTVTTNSLAVGPANNNNNEANNPINNERISSARHQSHPPSYEIVIV